MPGCCGGRIHRDSELAARRDCHGNTGLGQPYPAPRLPATRTQQLACSEPVALDATTVLLGHPRDPLPFPSSWHPAGICPWLLPCSTHWWEWEPSWGRLGQLIAEDDPRRRAGGRGHAGNAQAQGVTAPGASGRVFSSGELSLFLGGRF